MNPDKPPKAMRMPQPAHDEAQVLFEPRIGHTYKVERTGGRIEDGWKLHEIVTAENGDVYAHLTKPKRGTDKIQTKRVLLSKLKTLNAI